MDVKTYHCYKCGKRKPRTEFFKSTSRSSGLSGDCKQCQYKRPHHNYSHRREYFVRYAEQNYYKRQAQSKLRYAVKVGKIQKKPCEQCGLSKVEGHHKDYSKPLDVVWLCHKHHMEVTPIFNPPLSRDK